MKNIYVIYLYKCDSPMYMRRMSVSCWRYGLRWSGTDDFLWMRCFALWLLSCGGGRPCLPSGRTRAGLLRPVRQVEASFGSEVRTLIMECKTWSLTCSVPCFSLHGNFLTLITRWRTPLLLKFLVCILQSKIRLLCLTSCALIEKLLESSIHSSWI